MSIELNNHGFNQSEFLEVQETTRLIVKRSADLVELGMNYLDIEELILKLYEEFQVEKSWHPIKVRIDQDTNLSFREKSNPEIKVKNDSIFFMDIGVVKNGYEGDVGRSFSINKNPDAEKLINICHQVFVESLSAWKNQKLSGKALYDFAAQAANSHGVELNLSMDGHRIGSYPHGVFFKGGLAEVDIIPAENLWILEIQVKCPQLNLSAFFEDVIN